MARRILLIGGHGKISQLLTPLILSRSSWQLTSVIRDAAQESTVKSLGKNLPGKLDVLVSSVEDVKTQAQAQSIIDSTSPTYVIWSAGAGGKGGPERTLAIDRDACIAFIRAAAATPGVSKFLLVSYIGSRRSRAPWWSDADWTATQAANEGPLKNYYPAKVAADECLISSASQRQAGFAGISLRAGTLTDEAGQGTVALGKTGGKGAVRRGDVARVAMALLENEKVGTCWLDLLEGKEEVEDAVERCVGEQVNCVDGEIVEGTAGGQQ
ncbi:hypothetical protein IMSHALPRED_006906 [Imshaugia aleurites]|uniref:NAD(P)-binding domain-containing protein n=1 Tax=Imshaugia aleurites TaxID=172621 RepID=A0A8H3FMQ9_9LECA|nr:hypothetical protein IMSHALPRED_006906 [Imshaugia aleurites]